MSRGCDLRIDLSRVQLKQTVQEWLDGCDLRIDLSRVQCKKKRAK